MIDSNITNINTIRDKIKENEELSKIERSKKIKEGIANSQKRIDAAKSSAARNAKSKAHALRRRKVQFYDALKSFVETLYGDKLNEDEFENFIDALLKGLK